MSRLRRDEDNADKWLREHDPYYKDRDKNKKLRLVYLYFTPEQERRKRETEIPISNLNSSQKVSFKNIAGDYDDDGNFNL